MGYVGRLNRLKGSDLLAEAFRQVAEVVPQARLIIIGHGEEEGRVRYLLEKEIAGGRVRMVPGLNSAELGSWYRAMDVFVLPSRYENFSNALLEAAACGIPFIASDAGGNSLFQKIGAGQLFEPGSVEGLVRQMIEFINDAEPRRASGRACSLAVRSRFNWKASADRLEWILESRYGLPASAKATSEPNFTVTY
jgi:glycosyltransferase involved in cell wall biosynthesis